MDLSQIRALVSEYGTVAIVEGDTPPLIVRELTSSNTPASPTSLGGPSAYQEPSISEAESVPVITRPPARQDQLLERLNREIIALRDQVTREEMDLGDSL